ncbi:BMP family ABC transporter substrate-binding protein [Treponema sp.]|uniref:BMP family ABC transporter substrate-binding protein n=1 Tax=Treponema sp. TaxID=166 RepID=UPI0038909593
MNRNILITLITSFCFLLIFTLTRNFVTPGIDQAGPLKIGFAYDGDESIPYTNNFMRVQNTLREQFGDKIEIIVRSNIPVDQVDEVLEELVNLKCSIIFTSSYSQAIITKEIAQKYPEVQFCQACGDNALEEPVLKNYHTFMGEIYQGRYISGIAAGLKLKELIEKKIITEDEAVLGYVGAYPYSEIISGYTAFLLGARSIVPGATMKVMYTYTWGSFSEEKKCAEHLIDEGCVIISQHSDTTGTAVACEKNFNRNVFHIGCNQSMLSIAPMTSLISTRINWSPYVTGAVKAVLEKKKIESVVKGHVHGTDISGGLDSGWVQILEINPISAAEGTVEAINEAVQSLKKGNVNVFKGDYIGVNPFDEEDTYSLKKGFKENADLSYPAFCYVLKDVITIEE